MQHKKENKVVAFVLFLIRRAVKTVLFFAFALAVIYDYNTSSALNDVSGNVYMRLSDVNSYIVAMAAVLLSAILYISFGLSQRKPVFFSVDILFLGITAIYFAATYNGWITEIPADVSGYDLLLSNVKLLFHGLWLVATVVYIVAMGVKLIRWQMIEVYVEDGDIRREVFETQMSEQKTEKLNGIHRQLEQKEVQTDFSEADYRDVLLYVMREKVKLHQYY